MQKNELFLSNIYYGILSGCLLLGGCSSKEKISMQKSDNIESIVSTESGLDYSESSGKGEKNENSVAHDSLLHQKKSVGIKKEINGTNVKMTYFNQEDGENVCLEYIRRTESDHERKSCYFLMHVFK